MDPVPQEAEKSVRRSRLRRRVLLMLSSLGEAYPGQLARATGQTPTRLRWLMHGHMPYYDPALALVPLGLAAEVKSARGRYYEITSKGRRKARSLASGVARKAQRRVESAAEPSGQVTRHLTWSFEVR